MSSSYARELEVALRAVHRASLLTKDAQRNLAHPTTGVSSTTKADDSPVTVADFAAQALLISAVHAAFPSDSFVGEESAAELRANHGLRARVWDLVSSAPTVDVQGEPHLASPDSVDAMLEVIDLGTTSSTATGRVWVLDPIDGTATFMKGQQYTVCLCLLVDGVQVVAAIGCPNLLLDPFPEKIHESLVDEDGYGVVCSAVKGQGAFVRPMSLTGLGAPSPLQPNRKKSFDALDFVEQHAGKTSLSQLEHKAVAEHVGSTWPGTTVWSLQLKYVVLALGLSDVMLRLPLGRDRFTYIWDHAGGHLIFQEAGGVTKDIDGGDIDFGQGRKLAGERNYGMVAAQPWAFQAIMNATQEILSKRAE